MSLEQVRCPICEVDRARPAYQKFGLTLVRCQQCGLVYTHPRLPKEIVWQRYNEQYFKNDYLPTVGGDKAYDPAYFDGRYGAMLRLIASRIAPPGRLLEVGAGGGFFLKAAQRAGWNVAGVEVSAAAVRFAHETLALELRQEAAEALGFGDATFDVVAMFETIEHLLDPLGAVREVRRVLRARGLLVLTTPNLNALTRYALGLPWAVLSPSEHLFNFSEDTLRRLLLKAGFAHVRFERAYDGFGLFETMNPRYTHAPESARARLYALLIRAGGLRLARRVQAAGLADTLVVTAQQGPSVSVAQ